MSGHRSWKELDGREIAALARGSKRQKDGNVVPPALAPDRPRPGWPVDWRRTPPEGSLSGLALSGGGIRSATFNLGLLQGLDEFKLLDHFDYVSTVSGGGYVGGFWSAWLARNRDDPSRHFPRSKTPGTEPESPEVRHLREFSNFLRPRASLLSVETARIVAALLGGIVPCVAITIAVIFLAFAAWWVLGWLLTGQAPGEVILGLPWVPGLVMAALTGVLLIISEMSMWRRSLPAGSVPSRQGRGRYWLPATLASLWSGVLAVGVWFLAPSSGVLLLGIEPNQLPTAIGRAVTPAFPWLLTVGTFLFWRGLTSRFRNVWRGRLRQAATDRTLTRIFLFAVVWCVFAIVWSVGQVLADGGVRGVLAALGLGTTASALFSWLRRALMTQANLSSGGSTLLRLGKLLYQALAYLALAAIAAGIAALVVRTFVQSGAVGLTVMLVFALAILGLGLYSDPHEIGLHRFYRARLVRAYLGPSNPRAYGRGTEEAEGDDITLDQLADRPLHLVCCAANDLSGDSLGALSRGADTAVVSKHGLQVGDRWWPWDSRFRGPWLSDVLTASGAAFNSHMGIISVQLGNAVTFLLTALGLRLGLWLRRPEAEARSAADEELPAISPRLPPEEDDHRRPLRRPWGNLFLRELFSASRADADWVHLSDGAHFENLALYELIRRHCRFILLSDCGADPDRAFDDFGNAVRKVREDFGVEIDIDIRPLLEEDDGARQSMVAGDIHYPPPAEGVPGDSGVLLYFKPTLTDEMPPDVIQYASRNQRFPHETTVDQFYDEAQWESYRRLGQHAVRSAFDPLEGDLSR